MASGRGAQERERGFAPWPRAREVRVVVDKKQDGVCCSISVKMFALQAEGRRGGVTRSGLSRSRGGGDGDGELGSP
jgi:hypothetical protein